MIDKEKHQGNADECWLLVAAQNNIPMVVPGYEDSTFGNIFASHVKHGDASASIAKSGVEYILGRFSRYLPMANLNFGGNC